MNKSVISGSSGKDTSTSSSSVTNLSQFSSQSERDAFSALKTKSQLAHLTSTEISLCLENFRKEMFLRYLIHATCPLAPHETMLTRQVELTALIKEMSQSWQNKLKETFDRLQEIKVLCENIATRRDEFLSRFKVKKTSEAELHRVDEYARIFTALVDISKANYEKVTSEYLVLRHNGKVAQEVINTQYKDRENQHFQLIYKMEQYSQDMKFKLEQTKEFYRSELQAVTQTIRDDVMLLEKEAREIELKVGSDKLHRKNNASKLKKMIQLYRTKYRELQNKRKYELIKIRMELNQVQDMIKLVKSKIYGDDYLSLTQVKQEENPLLLLQNQLNKMELHSK